MKGQEQLWGEGGCGLGDRRALVMEKWHSRQEARTSEDSRISADAADSLSAEEAELLIGDFCNLPFHGHIDERRWIENGI